MHAQGGNERRYLEERNHRTVNNANDGANAQHNQQHNRDGQFTKSGIELGAIVPTLQQNGANACGQARHPARGQVGTLGNQAPGNAQGNNEANSRVGKQIADVILSRKVGLENGNHHGENHNQHDDDVVADEFENFSGANFPAR